MTKPRCADIETQVGEQLKSRSTLELYEHYLELMPILTCRSESLGLVLCDTNGYLLLPETAGNTPTKKPKTKLRHSGKLSSSVIYGKISLCCQFHTAAFG